MSVPNFGRAGDGEREENGEELVLLRQIAAFDRDALAKLFLRYHGRLFKFVFRLTGSHTIADEMVNDVMLVVWKKSGSFRGASKVSTWIFGIAYRLTMRRLSRRRTRLARQANWVGDTIGGDDNVEVEDWVQSGLHALPAAQQLAVVLVFYVGLSYEEVAAVTDCPVNTVKTRMFHARKKLRDFLATPSPATVVEEDHEDRTADIGNDERK